MPSRYRQIQRVVLRARELRGDERERWIAHACGDDADLRREVESLLAVEDRAGDAEVLSTGAGLVQGVVGPATSLPRRLGAYELVECLGEGGMGVVYRARQDEPIRREVAVKLIRWGFASEKARLRFDAEREALSRMDHPGIARVLDAGSDEDGSPYVVMELVRGRRVTRYCDEARLDVNARVELIRDICRAVHHAHQRGVVHRDLKPGNILVEEVDGRAVARIIDFGIAKAVQGSLSGGEQITIPGQLIGTPQYMSPEQVGSAGAVVDTRTDVYALGVLLFELLVGDTPLGRDTLDGLTFSEILGLVREFEAPVASRRLRSLDPERQAEVAATRRTRTRSLVRSVRGDLDWILARALDPDPEQRYSSAAELAEDLDRFLRGDVILAEPPTRSVRLRKFVRRHRALVTGIAAVFAVLVGGILTTAWQAQKASHQAERAAARLEDVRRFVIDFAFGLDKRLMELDGTAGTREFVVAETVRQLDKIVNDDDAGAVLEPVLGDAYRRVAVMQKELGQVEASLGSYQRGITLLQRHLDAGPDDVETLRNLGVIHDEYRRALSMVGRKNEQVEVLRQGLGYFERAVTVDPANSKSQRYLNICRINLAGALFTSGQLEEAREYYELGLNWRRAAARENPDDLRLQSDLSRGLREYSGFLWDTEDTLGSFAADDEMLRIARRVHDAAPDNRVWKDHYAKAQSHYAWHLALAHEFEEALKHMEEGTRVFVELRDDNPQLLRYEQFLGQNELRTSLLYQWWGRWDLQLDFARRSIETAERGMARDPGNVSFDVARVRALKMIGDAQLDRGSLDEAAEVLQRAVAGWDSVLAGDARGNFEAYQAAEAKYNLGCVYEAIAREGRQAKLSWAAARDWFGRSHGELRAIEESTGLVAYMKPLQGMIESSIAAADSALAD